MLIFSLIVCGCEHISTTSSTNNKTTSNSKTTTNQITTQTTSSLISNLTTTNEEGFNLNNFLEETDDSYNKRREYLMNYFLTYRKNDNSAKTGFGLWSGKVIPFKQKS